MSLPEDGRRVGDAFEINGPGRAVPTAEPDSGERGRVVDVYKLRRPGRKASAILRPRIRTGRRSECCGPSNLLCKCLLRSFQLGGPSIRDAAASASRQQTHPGSSGRGQNLPSATRQKPETKTTLAMHFSSRSSSRRPVGPIEVHRNRQHQINHEISTGRVADRCPALPAIQPKNRAGSQTPRDGPD